MKIFRFIFLAITLMLVSGASINARLTGTFNWQTPSSLTPSYPAPTSSNPSGEYIGNVVFSDNGVTISINDDYVKELSRKARFYYGYNTQVPELRVYLDSEIIITAPDGMTITSVSWQGAKVGDYYTECTDGKFDGNVWSPTTPDPPHSVTFDVYATINCTNVTVICDESAGVNDIRSAADNMTTEYYNIYGLKVENPVPGTLVIQHQGNTFRKVIIR